MPSTNTKLIEIFNSMIYYCSEIEKLYELKNIVKPEFISGLLYENENNKIKSTVDGEIIDQDKVIFILKDYLLYNLLHINELIEEMNNKGTEGTIEVIDIPSEEAYNTFTESDILNYSDILNEKIIELKKMGGGNKKTKKSDKYTVKQLKTMAFVYNVNTTKKSNGKIVNLKSNELLTKLKKSKIIL
jgi:hypothetical protein